MASLAELVTLSDSSDAGLEIIMSLMCHGQVRGDLLVVKTESIVPSICL